MTNHSHGRNIKIPDLLLYSATPVTHITDTGIPKNNLSIISWPPHISAISVPTLSLFTTQHQNSITVHAKRQNRTNDVHRNGQMVQRLQRVRLHHAGRWWARRFCMHTRIFLQPTPPPPNTDVIGRSISSPSTGRKAPPRAWQRARKSNTRSNPTQRDRRW